MNVAIEIPDDVGRAMTASGGDVTRAVLAVATEAYLCGAITLRKLFSQIVLPQAVVDELLHADAPESVRAWTAKLPSSLSVHDLTGVPPRIEKLQAGERGDSSGGVAPSDLILLDEKPARRVAIERGPHVTGTLGVLGEAAARGLVDLTAAMERLRKTNFRYSPALLKAILERFGPSKTAR